MFQVYNVVTHNFKRLYSVYSYYKIPRKGIPQYSLCCIPLSIPSAYICPTGLYMPVAYLFYTLHVVSLNPRPLFCPPFPLPPGDQSLCSVFVSLFLFYFSAVFFRCHLQVISDSICWLMPLEITPSKSICVDSDGRTALFL